MKILKKIFTNSLLIFTSIAIPIILFDQYCKFVGLPKNNGRVMLLSGGNLNSIKTGIKQYSPNSQLNHAAIYGSKIEYKYTFKTDKNGFRVTNQCTIKNESGNLVAITGDSFTEGQGSNISWISGIQKELCKDGYDSVNTSIGGYGIEDMERALVFAHNKLGARKAIVAIIADDIYRIYTPMISNKTCSMFGSDKDQKCGVTPTWWHHENDLRDEELISFANSKYDYGIRPVIINLKHLFKQYIQNENQNLTLLINLNKKFKILYKRFIFNSEIITNKDIIKRSILAMNSIISKYGDSKVTLFILPTKNDRGLSGTEEEREERNIDLQFFISNIANEKITIKDLRECPLNERHFYKIDGHPNIKGHKLLSSCSLN